MPSAPFSLSEATQKLNPEMREKVQQYLEEQAGSPELIKLIGHSEAKAERLVNDEVSAWYAWLRSRAAIPTVVALRTRFERVRQAELDRLAPRLAALGPEARDRVDEITRLMVEKLLLTPTEQLKAIDDHDTMDACSAALRRLFALDEEAAAAEADRADRADAARRGTRR